MPANTPAPGQPAQRRRTAEPSRWGPFSRRTALIGLVVVVAAIGAAVWAANRDRGPTSAVSVQGGPQGNQLHQFDANHHAPFISLADYKPIYDRKDPNYILVDVREAAERANSRIPGDIWAPLADADTTGWQFLEQYKNTKTLVLYCDCPWAEAAKESVILEAHGFDDAHLLVLHEGIPGWAQAGYPVVSGGNPCQTERKWPQACGR